MRAITALLHTMNDALRLGRCLETLYPCDEILVIDHGSSDETAAVAREYGALVVGRQNDEAARHYLQSVRSAWILCLDPRESLSEALAASLYEWKATDSHEHAAYGVHLREETASGWILLAEAHTRLVPREWNAWQGRLPSDSHTAGRLDGELLRFAFP